MEQEYLDWIEKNTAGEVLAGFCHSFCEKMRDAFPELIQCKGWYSSPVDGSRQHWWLKTVSGEIVDPTAKQFFMSGGNDYEEYSLEVHGSLPIGKCMNCGDEVYKEDDPPASCCCSSQCAKELEFI